MASVVARSDSSSSAAHAEKASNEAMAPAARWRQKEM